MLESYPKVGSPRVKDLPSRPGFRPAGELPAPSPDRRSAPRGPARLPLPTLKANYDGPVLLVTTGAIRPDPLVDPIGAPDMLHAVAASNVPIIYLPTDDQAMDMSAYPSSLQVSREDAEAANMRTGQKGLNGYMQVLRTQFPMAQLSVLSSNKGDDARLAATPGIHSYLRNTDPYQGDMPKGFKGILTDEYFENFQARLVHDLNNARQASVSCGGSPALRGLRPFVPVYPNPPALQKTSGLLKLGRLSRSLAGATTDIIGMLASTVEQRVRSIGGSLDDARGPQDALAPLTAVELSKMAKDILDSGTTDTEKSSLLYKVMTSHGTDGGHIDSILSCLTNTKAVDSAMKGAEQKMWTAHRQDGAPRIGDWSGFDSYLDGLTGTPAREGNKVQVLINGQESFDSQLEAIRNAKEFINFTTFTFSSDQFARHFLSELEAAANRGVEINIIKDKKGSEYTYKQLTTDPNLLQKLQQYSNVQYIETPDSPLFNHLNHRKVMMMDNGQGDGGQVGFIGGMNIANEYRMRWHDVHSRVEGPVLPDMNRMFTDQMRSYGGHVDAETEARMLRPQAKQDGGISARIVGHVGLQDHDLKYAYMRAINTAEKSIDIADPYLSDPDVLSALRKRAEDGLKVRIFIPRYNDKKYLKWAVQAYYKRLIQSGAEIYEYQGHEMAHEKVGVFDNHVTTIGSSNLDARSLSNNEEANLWSSDPTLAHEVTSRLFEADMPMCHRISEYEANTVQNALNEAAVWAEPLL